MQESRNQVPMSMYKDLISMVPKQYFAFFVQKIGIVYSISIQGLHSMSLAKLVPDGLKPQEWKRLHLSEPPPIPYMPKKDEVQEKVSKVKNLQLKILIDKDTTLNFPVWYGNAYGSGTPYAAHLGLVCLMLKMILWCFTICLELLDNCSRYRIYPLSALLLSGAPLT